MKRTFFALLCFLTSLTQMASAERVMRLSRPNGSELRTYFTAPDTKEQFPMVIYLQGSQHESVLEEHRDFEKHAHRIGAGLISMEKQGIYGPDAIEEEEFHSTNTLYHRLDDHYHLMDLLRDDLIPGWNGKIIIIGGSEGGILGFTLSAQVQETVASMIFSAGGGMDAREEVLFAARRYLEGYGAFEFVINNLLGEAEQMFEKMIADPRHDEHFYGFKWKWWAAHLTRECKEHALNIECPLYYAHGTADEVIPFESGELLIEYLRASGKENITFLTLDGYPHDVREGPGDVFADAIDWLTDVLGESLQQDEAAA